MSNEIDIIGDIPPLEKNTPSTSTSLMHAPPTPSELTKQFNRFTNTILSSATVSMIRALLAPPKPPISPETAAERLPKWFSSDYSNRWRLQSFFRQYSRDTVLLTGAAYLMDAVDWSMLTLRGRDDATNRMVGGMLAGSLVGAFWYPVHPAGRTVMGVIGALSGYGSFMMQQTTKVILMEAQKKLEGEVGVLPNERREKLDPYYVKELMRLKYILDLKRQQQGQLTKEESSAERKSPGLKDPSTNVLIIEDHEK